MRPLPAGERGRPPACSVWLAGALLLVGSCAPAYDLDTLLKDMQSADLEAREEASETIAKLVRDGDYKVFLRGLQSSDPANRAQSIVYLAEIGKPEARRALRDLLRPEKRMMLPYNPIRVRPSTDLSDSRILVAHLMSLGERDPEAVPALLEGVSLQQPSEILIGTCFALGALGDPAGIPFLVSATSHNDVEVARAAVQALGSFKAPEVLPALQGLMSHPAIEVRGDVLSALKDRQDAGAVDMIKTMATSDPSSDIRTAALRALIQHPNAALVPYLIERQRSGDPSSRTAAREALVRIAGKDLGPRPEAWSKWWMENRARLSSAR